MRRNRLRLQRPLKVYETPSQKLRRGLAELRRKKMIRQMVIDSARRHGIEVKEDGGSKNET
jgi:hypothetical protein